MNNDYIIQEDGRIWSTKTNRFLKYSLGKTGYYHTILRINGKSKCFDVHRLVAIKFCKNDHNFSQVNHIDGNKLNNHFLNLEWCTGSYNMKHSFALGLHTANTPWFGKYGKYHNRSIQVNEYNIDGRLNKTYGSLSEVAREHNCNVSTIYLCIKNKTKTRKGFYYSTK